jgi:hypothetical protein
VFDLWTLKTANEIQKNSKKLSSAKLPVFALLKANNNSGSGKIICVTYSGFTELCLLIVRYTNWESLYKNSKIDFNISWNCTKKVITQAAHFGLLWWSQIY